MIICSESKIQENKDWNESAPDAQWALSGSESKIQENKDWNLQFAGLWPGQFSSRRARSKKTRIET